MDVGFDKEGILHIRPETHSEAMTLKWFLKEFAVHGARVLNVETEVSEDSQGGGSYDRAFGYAQARSYEPIYDTPPFSPEMVYDNRISNIRSFRDYPREYGQRGNNDGGRGSNNPGIQSTRDRDRDNQR
jgi:hypothetical protein